MATCKDWRACYLTGIVKGESKMKKILAVILTIILSFSLVACFSTTSSPWGPSEPQGTEENLSGEINGDRNEEVEENIIDEDGYYTSKEDVALYIHIYDKLPNNFINKKEASNLGWKSSEGNLWEVTDKMSIGGDKFGNREKLLPMKEGRQYYECDINYEGGYRGPERLVYSNDGLIYYTEDHYESFTLLYGDE